MRFKGSAKSFTRLYGFLSQILPYSNAGWEKLSIFLNFLIPKLPAPEEEDLSKGILETVDMDTYRTERQATVRIALEDEDAEIDPIQAERAGGVQAPLMELLSTILDEFNKTWGNAFSNPDHVSETIKTMPDRVNEDEAYQNAKMHSDRQNARVEHDAASEEADNRGAPGQHGTVQEVHRGPSLPGRPERDDFQSDVQAKPRITRVTLTGRSKWGGQ